MFAKKLGSDDQGQLPDASPVLEILSNNMQEALTKYLLQYLLIKSLQNEAVSETASFGVSPPLSLNHLILSQRKKLHIPIPRYPSEVVQEKKIEDKDRRDSLSTTKEEMSPTFKKEPLETLDRSYHQPSRRAKPKKRTREEIRKIKMDLTFDNESGDLATRCDVVYKTILRDFRKFFTDKFKLFRAKNDRGSDLVTSLRNFTAEIYPEKSLKGIRETSLDLGCLMMPKEMEKDQNVLEEMEIIGNFGDSVQEIKAEIMRIHGFLYKFSIDKIEECFMNLSLCELFLTYASKPQSSRINSNPTMRKNPSTYLKACKILEDKASSSLSLEF